MKITDLWKESDKPTKSFELFPPRSEKAAERSKKTIDVLAKLKPDFASVTFGAGGSTREGSYQLLVNFSLSTCWIKIFQVMQQHLTSNAIKIQLI
jgi:methylenetetrahydrofolate reductase (NADPH)